MKRLFILPFALLAACRDATPAAEAAPAGNSGEIVIPADSPKLAAFTVDTAGSTHDRVLASLSAQVVLDEDHTVRVTSPVSGRITALLARPGDRVAAGAPLARIASGDFSQATSDVAKADAAVTQTTAALTRAEDLFAHRVVAQKDVEQARNDAAQAKAEAARAHQRAELLGGGAEVRGEYVLRAPVAGTVVDRAANPGAEVRPDGAVTLFTVSSLDRLWLVASVPQRDLPSLSRGATLWFRSDAAPGTRFEATVTWISDQLDGVTRTAQVRAVIANDHQALRAGVIGDARLVAHDKEAHATVPSTALVTSGRETVVFVEKARGRFERRVVQVVTDDGVTASLAAGPAGVKPGERIVTKGSLLLAAEAGHQP
ncbi:MAG: efflux RND transporter periplasmic adaptor subunit [Gemmatimonadetes bacterium]|nr:efflux RND transporter periplasmic adaptor subunit [Gemmatimonadota bacterium]